MMMLMMMMMPKMVTTVSLSHHLLFWASFLTFCLLIVTDPSHAEDIGLDDFLDDNEEGANFDPRPPAPAPPCNCQAQGLELDLQGLHIEADDADDFAMIIFHSYDWVEAVTEEQVARGLLRKRRLMTDVLLPGPTVIDQIEVIVDSDHDPQCKTLKFEYNPPATYLSAKRTAVRGADIAGVPQRHMNTMTIEQLSVMNRVTSHQTKLDESIKEQQRKITKYIKLPHAVEPVFCTRDDWGWDNAAPALSIGMYQHQDDNLHQNNQYVWILHIKMALQECTMKQTPSKPTVYANLAGLA